jgi:RNA polymerase sigma factor (sigma-70 family)
MQGGPLSEVLRRLRSAAVPVAGGLADAELLRRWVAGRDEAAFEVLLWRHGPMVLSLCRRWLPRHDADDAFQAVFLALARKAGGIRGGNGVAPWLHRVAYRVCLRSRFTGRRSALPTEVVDARAACPSAELEDRELRAALDEEVSRLPERYREPFVLCYFAGRTNAEAARELGRPVGTILSRLATARQRLRLRLSKRGFAPSALAGVLAGAGAAQATVPASLASMTLKAATVFAAGGAAVGACSGPAAALAEGVLKAMFAAKIKSAAAVVLSVALLGTGGGVFGYRAFGPGDARAQEGGVAGVAQAPAKESQEDLRKQIEVLRKELASMRDQLVAQQITIKSQQDQLGRLRGGATKVIDPRFGVEQPPDAKPADPASNFDPKAKVGGKQPPFAKPADDIGSNFDPKAKPADRVGPGKPPAVKWAAGGDLRDELELLQAQVAVKKAHLEAAMLEMKYAKARLARLSRLGAAAAVDQGTLETARSAADAAESQVRIREAELKAAVLRVSQVERKLKRRPEAVKEAPADRQNARVEERLRLLEKKLSDLLKEVQSLRGNRPSGLRGH